MTSAGAPIEIGLLIYPGAQLAAIYGLTDLFQVANTMLSDRRTSAAALRVSHWQPDAASDRVERVFDTHPGVPGAPRIILAPPCLGALPPRAAAARLAPWLIAQHAAGASLASVCAGAFLLAETGLLSGRTVTTHWVCAAELAERFPDIRVNADKLIIEDGDIITAGGLMAWTDLGLKLVDRLLGPTIMVETARFLLVDPPGREQRYYSNFSPRLQHGDETVLKIQHWLQAQGARDVTLAAMAARAGLGERTFLRRFRKATGFNPTEYCQHLRIGKARELLEFSTRPIDQIAWMVGYQDPGAFRKVFQKIMGLSPGEYRLRFSVKPADPAPATS